jgi:hypothetical protein
LNLEVLEPRDVPTTFTVTTTNDTNQLFKGSPDPHDSSGNISIRSALEALNANPGTNDMIIVPAGHYLLTTAGGAGQGTAGALVITDSVTIQGAGAVSTLIDAQQLDRVMDIGIPSLNPIVNLQGLTIENGLAPLNGPSGPNDADGGGILEFTNTLTLLGCLVTNNTAHGANATLNTAAGAGEGGAIYGAAGTLIIQDTTISNNKALGGLGGGGFAGGLGAGGAIVGARVSFNGTGLVKIQSSAITGNLAAGGDETQGYAGGDGDGGAFFGSPNFHTHDLVVSNSTVAGNTASGGRGGGLGFGGNAQGGGIFINSALITNTTIANNQANGGANNSGVFAPGFGEGGGLINDPGLIIFGSTIIAKNSVSGGSGGSATGTTGTDVFDPTRAAIASLGFNLIGDDDQPTNEFTGPHDLVGTPQAPIDPLLGPLQNNGGLTDTLALAPNSPAIDQGSNNVGGDINGNKLAFDQRESPYVRTFNLPPPNASDGTDIGAFELEAATLTTTPSFTAVTLGTSPVTLKDTATLTGGVLPTGTITFTLSLGSILLDTETVTVNGAGNYTTPNGFTLPTSGTATGTYQWDATYSGDASNVGASDTNNPNEQTVVSPASPTLVTTASPALTLNASGAPTLSDTADLEGAYFPTGSIVFTLSGPGGFTYSQTDTVTANGTYTASSPLPTAGTVAGTYTWTAHYSGDANNKVANDQGGTAEQTVVSPAQPTLVTTASPAITLGTTAPTLSDTAKLSGAYFPTGSIIFTLSGPGGFTYSQTDTVTGNGTYTASTPLPTTGTVAGTCTWTAHYSGDANNKVANDQGGAAEQTVVSPASPTLVTTASPAITLGTTAPTLTDSAVLSGAYFQTGSIVFTLSGPGGFTYSQTDTVTGNGTSTASTSLPTTGTVAGTYTWSAHYSGDANNKVANDQGGTAEQTVVSPASPMLVTTASPAITLNASGAPTLSDTADLEGAYFPTGSIVFTLSGPGGFTYSQTDTVTANGTSTASTSLPTTGMVAGTYTWSAHYGGDANNKAANDQGGTAEQTVVSPASPTLVTTASPANTLNASGAPTLSDTAVLSGAYFPTGSIIFTLSGPGGFTYSQTDTVTGNGTYTASTPLPTTGTVAGTYTWSVTYTGDANNTSAVDQGGTAEQTVVSPASPTLVTTASPAITLNASGAPTLSDTADLEGAYFPTGSIVFTLSGPGGFTYSQTDTVTANGTYTASTPLPTTGTVAGTYTWSVTYTGDANNTSAVDQSGTAEQTVVSPASPTIVTTPNPTNVLVGNSPVVLKDSATLSGGYHPTGTITLTLVFGSTSVDTETVPVNGNGTYSTPTGFTLPRTGTVAGTYQWNATYSSDANDNAASDTNDPAERVSVVVPPQFASKVQTFASNLLGKNGSPTAQAAFVDSVYMNLLNRSADPAGLANWVLMLQEGVTRTQVVQAIWQSAEHRGLEVDQDYMTLLHRPADPTGRATWVGAFLRGATEQQVMAGLLLSPEYQATHASNQAFVTGLFADVLGRPADAPGLSAWLQALQTGTGRAAVAYGFLNSTELEGDDIARYYTSFLGRTASAAEVQAWLTLLQNAPVSPESVGEAILGSAEYFAKFANL